MQESETQEERGRIAEIRRIVTKGLEADKVIHWIDALERIKELTDEQSEMSELRGSAAQQAQA